MRMSIANRNANHDHGYGFLGQMDCSAICRTSTPNGVLHRYAEFFRQAKRVSLVAWICYHSGINVTQHRTMLNSSLDHIRFNTSIIRRAAFKDDCNIRFDNL